MSGLWRRGVIPAVRHPGEAGGRAAGGHQTVRSRGWDAQVAVELRVSDRLVGSRVVPVP